MNIKVIASGSSGNAYLVGDSVTQILIECGVSVSRIQTAINFRLSDIDFCIISHSHGDHAKSAQELIRRGVDVYTSVGTIEARGLSGHRVHAIKALEQFTAGTFIILPLDVEHDAPEPLGFLIESTVTKEKLLYITDLFYLRYTFKHPGITHMMVEANYSIEILRENVETMDGMAARKSRILESHMSIENLVDMLKSNDLSKVRQIYLIHMSSDNSDPEAFKETIQRLTGAEVYTC